MAADRVPVGMAEEIRALLRVEFGAIGGPIYRCKRQSSRQPIRHKRHQHRSDKGHYSSVPLGIHS